MNNKHVDLNIYHDFEDVNPRSQTTFKQDLVTYFGGIAILFIVGLVFFAGLKVVLEMLFAAF